MKLSSRSWVCLRPLTVLLFLSLLPHTVIAQVSQAWVARYNGGFTNGTSQAAALTLDSTGNLLVAGSSQNATNGYDYVVFKYNPGGQEIWSTRYTPVNGNGSAVNGFALDPQGNAYLTGSGGTLKVGMGGDQVWTAPYYGNALAVDTNGYVVVTGGSTFSLGSLIGEFTTTKLDPSGAVVWNSQYVQVEGQQVRMPALSEKVVLGPAGEVYVAGWAASVWLGPGCYSNCGSAEPFVVKYDVGGNQIWVNGYTGITYEYPDPYDRTVGFVLGSSGNLYVCWLSYEFGSYATVVLNSAGQMVLACGSGGDWPGATSMAVDADGDVFMTGNGGGYGADTQKCARDGTKLWERYSFQGFGQSGVDAGVAVDATGNAYVIGAALNAAGKNAWLTLAYGPEGNQQWAAKYNGPANGNDAPTALIAAPDGSVYVTGYSANASGGTDITTIKYVQFNPIESQAGKPALVQCCRHRRPDQSPVCHDQLPELG